MYLVFFTPSKASRGSPCWLRLRPNNSPHLEIALTHLRINSSADGFRQSAWSLTKTVHFLDWKDGQMG